MTDTQLSRGLLPASCPRAISFFILCGVNANNGICRGDLLSEFLRKRFNLANRGRGGCANMPRITIGHRQLPKRTRKNAALNNFIGVASAGIWRETALPFGTFFGKLRLRIEFSLWLPTCVSLRLRQPGNAIKPSVFRASNSGNCPICAAIAGAVIIYYRRAAVTGTGYIAICTCRTCRSVSVGSPVSPSPQCKRGFCIGG